MDILKSIIKFLVGSLGLFAAVISVYLFLWPHKPVVVYNFLSRAKIIEVADGVSNLSIMYKDRDLRSSNENLMIFTIKIENKGQIDILKTMYDDQDSIGVKINEAVLVESPVLLDASNKYLKNNIKFNLSNDNEIRIIPVIIETGEFFVFKFVVLFNKDVDPVVLPVGKIAGITSYQVIDVAAQKRDKIPFEMWQYYIAFIFIVVIVEIAKIFIKRIQDIRIESDLLKAREEGENRVNKRDNDFSNFLKKEPNFPEGYARLLRREFISYTHSDDDYIKNKFIFLECFLSESERLEKYNELYESRKSIDAVMEKDFNDFGGYFDKVFFGRLLMSKVIYIEKNNIHVSAEFLNTLKRFNVYLSYL